jgi:hypothetical protein
VSAQSRRLAATATALEARPSNAKLQTRLAVMLPALRTAATAAIGKFQADLLAADLAPELNAIVAANPSSTGLAAHAQAAGGHFTAAIDGLEAMAPTLGTNFVILADHADAIPFLPSLLGTWAGNATTTGGVGIGSSVSISIRFTSQGADGTLAGTATITESTGAKSTLSLTGTVNESGAFSAVLSGAQPGEGATLSGSVSGTTLSGSYVASEDNGVFSLSRR